MIETRIQQYQYLWDGTAPQWALANVGAAGAAEEYVIVNTQSKSALLMESNEEAEQVIQKMLDAGVRIVTPGNGF